MLPDPVKDLLERIQNVSEVAIMTTKKDIKSQLEKVDGFLDVQMKKREIARHLTDAIAENEDMKVIATKCEELMRPGVLPDVKQDNDDRDT
jgi:hypothetical protein